MSRGFSRSSQSFEGEVAPPGKRQLLPTIAMGSRTKLRGWPSVIWRPMVKATKQLKGKTSVKRLEIGNSEDSTEATGLIPLKQERIKMPRTKKYKLKRPFHLEQSLTIPNHDGQKFHYPKRCLNALITLEKIRSAWRAAQSGPSVGIYVGTDAYAAPHLRPPTHNVCFCSVQLRLKMLTVLTRARHYTSNS